MVLHVDQWCTLHRAARKIRIAVGSAAELHSSAWTIWTRGDDLYAASSSSRGFAKLSVHASGVCRYAWTSESGTTNADEGADRVLERWRIQPVGASDWETCFSLAVPTIFVPRRFDHNGLPAARRASIVWVPPAAIMHGRLVTLFRAKSPHLDIREAINGGYDVIGQLSLQSGGIVWVTTWVETSSDAALRFWQSTVGDFRINFPSGIPSNPLATMMSPAPDTSYPLVREVALGWNNLTAHEA